MNVALFSTFTDIPPSSTRSPDLTGCFVNLYGKPIWVKDITWDWDWTVPERDTVQTYGTTLGDVIRCGMKYQNHQITNGRIPVCLLAKARNWRTHTEPFQASGAVVHSTFTWTFASPLWLPPNIPLTIEIGHMNDFVVQSPAANQTVDVTIRGTIDDSGIEPEYIDIPYATSFLGAVQSNVVGGTTGLEPIVTEQTAQTDLFNPFSVPLNIDRMQYEISISSHGTDVAGGAANANFAPTDATSAQDQTSLLAASQNYGLDRRYVQMKLTSSRGRNLVKDFLPLGCVIPSTTRSWEAKSVLAPAAYYVAFLQEQMPLFTDRGALPFQMRVGLSLVGSRRLTIEEAFSTYWR
jgi:hypothetical protein